MFKRLPQAFHTMQMIPTFSSDGKRLRNYALRSIEALLESGKVAVERNRKGAITCATMRSASGANPIQKSAHMGQSYSYLQHLPSGHTTWSHCSLIDTSEGLTSQEQANAEVFVREVFLAVPRSVTVTRKPAPVVCIDEFRQKRLAPVICIDSFRNRKVKTSVARPIEFDSQRRAA